MKKRKPSDSLLKQSNDVFNAGMKLFHEAENSSAVNMLKCQAELIELLERFLIHRVSDSQEDVETDNLSHFNHAGPGIKSNNKAGGLPSNEDLSGVSRYLLTCWLDELFVVETSLSRLWNENKLEMRVFGTNDRAWRFWDYVNSESISKSIEIQQIAQTCVMLGFQGQLVDSYSELSGWVEKNRACLFKSVLDSWTSPPGLPLLANTPELKGHKEFELAIRLAILIVVILIPSISFLSVYYLRN